jgi:hypothetical protein
LPEDLLTAGTTFMKQAGGLPYFGVPMSTAGMRTLTPAPTPGEPPLPLSCQRLRAAPGVFLLVTGLTPAEFDELLADLRPRYKSAEDARLARPGRRNARGAGHPFALPLPDRALLALLHLRYRPMDSFVAYFFRISELTAWRTRSRFVPLLRECRYTELLVLRRRRLTPRLAWRLAREVPEFRHFLNTFAQWARDPKPPERPRPAREKKVVPGPPCPFADLKKRIQELLSASRQETP